MSRSYAILVDGGFLKRKLGSRQAPLNVEVFKDFIDRLCAHKYLKDIELYRVYYYDAPPLEGTQQRPLQGGLQDFGNSSLAGINKRLLHGLGRFPNLVLRLGELVFRGWQIRQEILREGERITITSDDLSPVIHQRGVDVQISLDISQLTLSHQVDTIVLIGGDSDLVPAMEFSRQGGCQFILVTLGHSVRDSMYLHSDLVIEDLDSMGGESRDGGLQHDYHSSPSRHQQRSLTGDQQQYMRR